LSARDGITALAAGKSEIIDLLSPAVSLRQAGRVYSPLYC